LYFEYCVLFEIWDLIYCDFYLKHSLPFAPCPSPSALHPSLLQKNLHPKKPHQENHEIEKCLENIVVEEMELRGPGFEDEGEADDADDVDPFDDDETEGDVPELVFPGAGEEEHEEEPVHPLFKASAAGADHHIDPLAIVCLKVNGLVGLGDIKIDMKNVLKHPLALVEEQEGCPIEKYLYLVCKRVKFKWPAPVLIQVVKTHQQQRKQSSIFKWVKYFYNFTIPISIHT
jgi:hypothetical protein